MTDLLPGAPGPVVLAHQVDGYVVIPVPSPLARLNFFDGRLLRGTDLTQEQKAERELLFALSRTGGPGVANGLDVVLSGESVTLSPGLAVDPDGRMLLLPDPVTATVDDLLDATQGVTSSPAPDRPAAAAFAPCETNASAPAVDMVGGTALHLLTIAWVEGLCGNAEVYGAPCEQACGTSTARPYRIDGIVLRLRPLTLARPLPASAALLLEQKHLRSRVAAAYFADERAAAGPPMSAALLASERWCRGTVGPAGSEVPLAVLGRSARTTEFADMWTVRRELLEPPARGYSDSRLAMRSRSVFAAQISQFQCQLAELSAAGLPNSPAGRILVDAGVVELPPAGYLPIDPAGDLVQQVSSLLGPGVDLRFVPVPTDQVPHEVEEVQHRDRLSLLVGIDDPSARPDVDILVPDGQLAAARPVASRGYVTRMRFSQGDDRSVQYNGVARFPIRHAPGFKLATAGFCTVSTSSDGVDFVDTLAEAVSIQHHTHITAPPPTHRTLGMDHLRRLSDDAAQFAAQAGGQPHVFSADFDEDEGRPIAVRGMLSCDHDLWRLQPGETALTTAQLDLYAPYQVPPNGEEARGPAAAQFELFGRVEVSESGPDTGATRRFRFTGQLGVGRGDRPGPSRSVQFALTATLSEQPDSRLFEIRFGRRDEPITLELKNDGSVLWAAPNDVLTARFTHDPHVLAPDNPLRLLAELSLGLLRGSRTAEPEFYDRARADLFGASGTQDGTTVLTPLRDWVAFRRRCVDPPSAAAPETRSVVVWVAAAVSRGQAAEWATGLHRGNADELPWKRVRAALFDAGTPHLRTAPGELRGSYASTGAPTAIHHVGFGAAAPPPAGRGRAAAIAAALTPAAILDPEADIAQVATAPVGLLEPDSDGSVFLIAYPPVSARPSVLQVVGLDSSGVPNREFEEAIRNRNLDAVDSMTTRIGTVRTTDGSLDQESFDTTLRRTDDAVQKRFVAAFTPALWIDPHWADSDPEAARELTAVAEKFASHVSGQIAPRPLSLGGRVEHVPLANSERQALLILHYVVPPGCFPFRRPRRMSA
ncbi:hypothetical protein ACFZCU_44545 [Streptomyces canus]|uniref:hypothetical protein n=1 Tax=Streptomyces canus TaxID=58343 RepID=UPI0036E61E95